MGKTTFIKNLFASYARDPDFKVASASTPTSREVCSLLWCCALSLLSLYSGWAGLVQDLRIHVGVSYAFIISKSMTGNTRAANLHV